MEVNWKKGRAWRHVERVGQFLGGSRCLKVANQQPSPD